MKNEWLTEPDVKVFLYLDFVCVIVRHPEMLNLCGYVFIPPEHPLHGKSDEETDLSVHGGLTYAGHYQREKSSWALGFDCAHYADVVPLIQKMHTSTNVPLSVYDKGATYKISNMLRANSSNLLIKSLRNIRAMK